MEGAGETATWQQARRILAVRLDAMGDVCMTGPALRALRRGGGRRHLTLLTSPEGAAVAEMMPGVDEVISYRAPWMKPPAAGPGSGSHSGMIERIRAADFGAAVIFTVYSQSPLPAALMLHLAGVPLRLAYCRENPYGLLSDWVRETEPEQGVRHEVQRHLDLVKTVGAEEEDQRMQIDPPRQATRRVRSLLAELDLTGRRDWITVHVGASAPSRRYPPELFACALQKLSEEHGITPLFTGSDGERDLIEEVRLRAGMPGVDLGGRLDLTELVALLEQSPLLLANNTGPVHLAAAVGTPVVDLYALTNPQHTPWSVPSRVLFNDVPCRNCYSSICPEGHHLCLRGVAPDTVARAVVDLLAQTSAPEPTMVGHGQAG